MENQDCTFFISFFVLQLSLTRIFECVTTCYRQISNVFPLPPFFKVELGNQVNLFFSLTGSVVRQVSCLTFFPKLFSMRSERQEKQKSIIVRE